MPTLQCNSNVSQKQSTQHVKPVQPVAWLLRDKKTGRLFLETSDLRLVESAQSSESQEAIAVPNGAVIRKPDHTYAKDFARATRLRASAKDVYDIATRKLKELPLFSGKEGDVATTKLHQAKAESA